MINPIFLGIFFPNLIFCLRYRFFHKRFHHGAFFLCRICFAVEGINQFIDRFAYIRFVKCLEICFALSICLFEKLVRNLARTQVIQVCLQKMLSGAFSPLLLLLRYFRGCFFSVSSASVPELPPILHREVFSSAPALRYPLTAFPSPLHTESQKARPERVFAPISSL